MQQLSAQAGLFNRREQFSSEGFGVDQRAQAVAGSLVCERPPALAVRPKQCELSLKGHPVADSGDAGGVRHPGQHLPGADLHRAQFLVKLVQGRPA